MSKKKFNNQWYVCMEPTISGGARVGECLTFGYKSNNRYIEDYSFKGKIVSPVEAAKKATLTNPLVIIDVDGKPFFALLRNDIISHKMMFMSDEELERDYPNISKIDGTVSGMKNIWYYDIEPTDEKYFREEVRKIIQAPWSNEYKEREFRVKVVRF